MIQKWKIILANWINCYIEDVNHKLPVTVESILNIISHLRENFSLDESKSSLLEAVTISDFILEKFPAFKFENGKLEPSTEEELYMAATLLLFFVCVNSKDVNIKSAMCSKLSAVDQETILKFSKCLMQCPEITSLDVLAAVTEACGQDIASAEVNHVMVAETPPALRSLHSEVRRLQAALEAERFDRNYLQEELARTNLKMEKLLKDKEQYKQDIVNLKAKISTCCGQENETKSEASNNHTAKLVKQLELTEERLVNVQEQLDDVIYQRDTYKNKLDEMKRERDKWFAISQEESNRASQLVEDLELERRQNHSLKELVTELRQHNRLNGLDTSQLECDDMDTSVQSLPHNISVCSEACANVIEVQLGEERAKIVLLNQQIQMFQDQLNDLNKKYKDETQNLTQIITEKDTDIFNLKHRINEEIEDRNAMKSHYDNEVTKLNNEVNELEQRLRDTGENSRRIIDSKMKEIQILHEEKLSLLQSLSDEITKSENLIKDLKADFDSEKTSKFKMREEYEKQMMTLKEKVSNRNNELVELQNKIFEKGETIEELQSDLRKEKDLSNKYLNDIKNLSLVISDIRNNLQKTKNDVFDIKKQFERYVSYYDSMIKDINHLNSSLAKATSENKVLEEYSEKLKNELLNRDIKIEKIQKDIEDQEIVFTEEKKKLQYSLDEINATVDALKSQLHNEIQYKISIEDEREHLEGNITKLQEELTDVKSHNVEIATDLNKEKEKCKKLNKLIEELNESIVEKDSIIKMEKENLNKEKVECEKFKKLVKELNECIVEKKSTIQIEKEISKKANEECEKLNKLIEGLNKSMVEKDSTIKMAKETLTKEKEECEKLNKLIEELNESIGLKDSIIKTERENLKKAKIDFDQEFCNKEAIIHSIDNKLLNEIAEKDSIKHELEAIVKEKDILLTQLKDKENNIVKLHSKVDELNTVANESTQNIKELKEEIINKTQELRKNFDTETTKLMTKIAELDKSLKKLHTTSNNTIKNNELQIEVMKLDLEKLQVELKNEQDKVLVIGNEKTALIQQLDQMNKCKNEFEKEYLNKCVVINRNAAELNADILKKQDYIDRLKHENDTLSKKNADITEEINTLKSNIHQVYNDINDKENQIEVLSSKVEKLKSQITESKQVIANNSQVITSLQNENVQLQSAIEDDKRTREIIVKERDLIIENREKKLQDTINNLEKLKIDMNEKINIKDEQIIELSDKINKTDATLQEKDILLHTVNVQVKVLVDEKNKMIEEIDSLRKTCTEGAQTNDLLKESFINEKAAKEIIESEKQILIEDNKTLINKLKNIESERDTLLNEKAILVQQLMDERSILKIADQGKEALLIEKLEIDKQLKELRESKKMLVQEKECLTQQLVEERHSKELAEQEKKNISQLKRDLEEKLNEETKIRSDLEMAIASLSKDNEIHTKNIEGEKSLNMKLEEDIIRLKENVQSLINENERLNSNITSLRKDLHHCKKIEEILINDKTILTNEKELLLKNNDVIKAELQEINENYHKDTNNKQQEIKKLTIDFNSLKTDYKTIEENNKQIGSVLNCGLVKIFENIKNSQLYPNVSEKYEDLVKENLRADEFCDVLDRIICDLSSELALKQKLENMLKEKDTAVKDVLRLVGEKDKHILELKNEIQDLHKAINNAKSELSKQNAAYNTSLESKTNTIAQLQVENQSLNTELDDLKVQLDVKVHSLKDKLVDNENLTDRLKETYEVQIDNLNMMISKLTNYLKEKTIELDTMRVEKEKVENLVENKNKAIKSLEEDLKIQKQKHEKLITEFDSEKLVLKNMVTVTESVMDDQKNSLSNTISEHINTIEMLEGEIKLLKSAIISEKNNFESELNDKEEKMKVAFDTATKELNDVLKEKQIIEKDLISQVDSNKVLESKIVSLAESVLEKVAVIDTLKNENNDLIEKLEKHKQDIILLEKERNEFKIKNDIIEVEFGNKFKYLNDDLEIQRNEVKKLENLVENKTKENIEVQNKVNILEEQIIKLVQEKEYLESDKIENLNKITELNTNLERLVEENENLKELKKDNEQLLQLVEEKKSEIVKLEVQLKAELNQQNEENIKERINLTNKCSILEEYQSKAETELDKRQKEINILEEEVKSLKSNIQDSSEQDRAIIQVREEKDAMITKLNEQMSHIQISLDDLKKKMLLREEDVRVLTNKLIEKQQQDDVIKTLQKENENLRKAMGQIETFAGVSQEKSSPKSYGQEIESNRNQRDLHYQVDTTTDTHSIESYKTITDLEKIIHDKNRTITTLQSDIIYLKSLIAESENKLLDVSKDLEMSKENCQQLSSQLKKIVHQKNDEIADLKNKVTKMSATENRASQIIKVSAKYQAIILKRIAEIKSNTVLKELTNFGNSNSDNEIRRSLTAGTITMEDLENFLETTERHIRRCSEKQIALQKERDRLNDINKINESEIIGMKKFLAELSVSIKTFNSVRELYTQKLSRVVSLQRTVRREILSLDGHLTDATMCKLERGYAAVMQDLSECTMNLERWIERYISRTISAEKIKQAFTSDVDRASLISGSFQNAGLEVQLEEVQTSFQKLLEEVARAQKGEGAKDAQSVTVMEVRAEYEDKLNRMKAKMKQLCHEQIALCKEKHREEVESLELEVKRAHHKLRDSSRAYEEHIKNLTTDLWNVGEKFLVKKDEADWLRRKQKSGSLMSLQHVHSSGFNAPPEQPSRPSDTQSLRSLPVTKNKTKEGRTLQMSDEEGEVFDNRCLRELATPRREAATPCDSGVRLSELRWRNSLCPPHLKSSYPAEMQFAPALHEEDIKCTGNMSLGGKQRKEVGITVYKKPGPPTPSKQAGRLSATDSELRQSLRVEADPCAGRKTSTPSRLRALFRSAKNDTTEGTPRSRRLSNIFRKK